MIAQLELRERGQGADCVADNGFCPDWIRDNFGDVFATPLWEHVQLTLAAVGCGFAIAFSLALLAHRQRWLAGPIVGVTGALYTLPSLAFIFLLLPITGFGFVTALIALTSYTLLILFRNIITGLQGVSEDAKDAARGLGFTERQLLWRVELPLALPEIVAGLRIATTTTVGLATLSVFAQAGGLGEPIYDDIIFKSQVVTAGVLCVLLAVVLDVLLLLGQRALTPWRRI